MAPAPVYGSRPPWSGKAHGAGGVANDIRAGYRVSGRFEMVLRTSRKPLSALIAAIALAFTVAACGGDDSGGGGEGGQVTLSWLVDNSEGSTTRAEALIAAFNKKNPNIKIELETRPQGGEGDNLVKTRLATQEMTHVF